MGKRYRGDECKNARFLPKLKRRPHTAFSGTYIYCPNFLSKHPELEHGVRLEIAEIPDNKADPTVAVEKIHVSGQYNVFWEDLRRSK